MKDSIGSTAPVRRQSTDKLILKQLPILMALGFAVFAFLISELMHFLLVPELGRHAERVVAEGVAALIVGALAAFLFRTVMRLRETTFARLQVIAEMNHHIRNALATISLSTYVIQDQKSVRFISEAVNRIEWALREILPREQPGPAAPDGIFSFGCWERHDPAGLLESTPVHHNSDDAR